MTAILLVINLFLLYRTILGRPGSPPDTTDTAPASRRVAFLQSLIILGLLIALVTELMSSLRLLTPAACTAWWGSVAITLSAILYFRHKRPAVCQRDNDWPREWIFLAVLMAATALLGALSAAINAIILELKTLTALNERKALLDKHQKSAEMRYRAGLENAIGTQTANRDLALLESEIVGSQQRLLTGHIQFLRAIGSEDLFYTKIMR